jgi:hypothetical protein
VQSPVVVPAVRVIVLLTGGSWAGVGNVCGKLVGQQPVVAVLVPRMCVIMS